MATVDSLEIQIQTSARAAWGELDKLVSKVRQLEGALNFDARGIQSLNFANGDNIRKLGGGMSALASGMQRIKAVGKVDFDKIAAGVRKLSDIPAGNLTAIGNAMRPLADGLNALGSANIDSRNLQGMINSLSSLANANIGSLSGANFTQLGNSIKEFANAASGAEKVEQSTIAITGAVAKLAQAGNKIPAVSASLGQLGDSLKSFIEKMSSAPSVSEKITSFTQAVGTLAGAGSKTKETADGLARLGEELKKFMQTMSTAPNVSENVIRMTDSLARLAGQGNNVTISSNSVSGSFSRLSGFSGKLGKDIGKLSGIFSGLKNSVNGVSGKFKSLTSQLMSAAGVYFSIYGAIRGLKSAIDISSDLTEVQNVVDVAFGNMAYKVEEFAKVSVKDFGMSELTTKEIAGRFQAMATAIGVSADKIGKANTFLSGQTKGYVAVSDSMADVSINLTKLAADMASFYNVEQTDVAKSLESIFTGTTAPLRRYGLDLTQATLKEWAMKQGIDANIQSMSQAEKTMLRYQYVLANTTAAQNDFSKTALTWSNQVRVLKQQFEILGSVIGGVFINAFKPLIITLNNVMAKVISFAKTVADALGTIFGWTFEINPGGATNDLDDMSSGVEDVADSADDASKSLSNTTKKAKELKANLQGFDKLNVVSLDKDDDSSGSTPSSGKGSGSGSGISAGGLDTGLVETDTIFKKYKSGIDTLYKLGEYIGETLTKALNSINWDKVYAAADNFGIGLAQFLNGLISPELFAAVGRTIAGALNTALHVLDNFGATFDWKNLGDSLKAGLVAFLEGIDWETALSAAANWGTGIATTLNSFISPEAFGLIGESVAKAINVALQFLDNFGTTFKWANFGKSLGAGLNKFLKGIDWKLYLKDAKTYGKGIANTINSFLNETDFKTVGKSVAQLLNGAIVFALSSGKTIQFKTIGKKIADGLNGFFKTLKVKELAQAINVWIKGALDAVTTLLKKTDFEMIGRKIGKFLAELDFLEFMGKMAKALWEAIKGAFGLLAGMISEAPIESALIAAFAVMKFAGVGKMVATSVSGSLATGLAGRLGVDLMSQNATISGVVTSALQNAFNGPIQKVLENLGKIVKGAGVAALAFGEFSLVSDAFKNLTEGTGNFVAEIGKIAGAAAVAGAGLTAILGFPAGVVATAIVGVVGAIKGINDAFDEIKAEVIGESIKESLSNPGGIPVDELCSRVSDSIAGIGNSFSSISEQSSKLDLADKNIKDIISQIQLVEEELKAGTITSEEAAKKFNSLLSELQTAVSTKVGAINQYMVSAFGEGGAWGKAWENAGLDASEAVGKTLNLTSEMQVKFDELVKKLSETDPTSPEWQTLQTQLYSVIGETDSLEKALNNFSYAVSAMEVDYSGLVTEEGELDSGAVEEAMAGISTAVKNANSDIDTAGAELSQNLQDAINSARKAGDSGAVEYFSQKLNELPAVIKSEKDRVKTEAQNMANTLQSGLVDNLRKAVDDAQKEWDGLTDKEKSGWGNLTSFTQDKIKNYVDKVITPFSQNIEKEMGQLGIKGAGWSEKAGQEIIDGIYNYNYDSPNAAKTESGIINDYKRVIDNAASGTEGYARTGFNLVGSALTAGLAAGINAISVGKDAKGITDSLLNSFKAYWGIHSPSTVMKDQGGYMVEGLKAGISSSWKNISSWWKKNAKLPEIKASIEDIKKKVTAKWKEVTKWWGKKELSISAKFETTKSNVSSWLKKVKDWWGSPKIDIKNNFATTQANVNSWWSKVKTWWGNKLLDIKNEFTTKQADVSSWLKKVKVWWGSPKLKVYNEFATKKAEVVSWWTSVKNWWGKRSVSVKTEYTTKDSTVKSWGTKTVSWLKSGINAAWSSFSTWFTDKMKKLMNGAINGMNWVLKKVGSSTTVPAWPGYARGSANGLSKNTVGMVNDQRGSTYKELIVPPHGKPFIPEGRNVVLPMQKGTKILPAEKTKELLKIIPRFETGAGDFSGSIFDYIDKPKEILKIGMNKHIDMSEMVGPALSIAKSAVEMFADKASGFIKKIFDTEISSGIEGALRWMINIANDDTHGYDQARRTGPDYDCSSLITIALGKSGLPISVGSTSTMYGQLTKAGFRDVVNSVNISNQSGLKRGDILLAPGHHTAAYLGKGQIVHASINELGKITGGRTGDQTGREIRVAPYYNKPWKHVLRYFGKFKDGIGKVNLFDVIRGYASGGFPASGQLFMARENGISELVGKIGNQTAVMNNQQIVKSVSEGVAKAVEKVMPDSMKKALAGFEKNTQAAQRTQEFLADAKITLSVENEITDRIEEISTDLAESASAGIEQDFTSLDRAIEILRNQVITGIVTAEDEMELYGAGAVSEYSNGIYDEQDSAYDAAEDTAETVEVGVSSAEEAMRSAGSGIIYKLQEGMKEKWEELTEWIKEQKESLVKLFEDAGEIMKPVGESIASGILEGIQSMWASIEETAGKIKEVFNISKSMTETAAGTKETISKTASSASSAASKYKTADLSAGAGLSTGILKNQGAFESMQINAGERAGTQFIQTVSTGVADAVNRIVVPQMEKERNISITMQGDVRKIFTAMVEENNSQKIRTGRYGFQQG